MMTTPELFSRYTSVTNGKMKLAETIARHSLSWGAETLLDLGSGDGSLLSMLAPVYQTVFAVEFDEKFREKLTIIPNLTLYISRMEDLASVPNFDVALMSYSLTGVVPGKVQDFLSRLSEARGSQGHILCVTYRDGCPWDAFADIVYRELAIDRTGGLARHNEIVSAAGYQAIPLDSVNTSIWGESAEDLASNLSYFFTRNIDGYRSGMQRYTEILKPFLKPREGGGVQLDVIEDIIEVVPVCPR